MKKNLFMAMFIVMFLWISSANGQAKTIDMGEFKLTAYCPCHICSEGYGRATATGKRARSNHTVAVDPSAISYGTKIKIGDKIYTAEDCGGGVKGDHIDIFVDTHEETLEFGVQYKDIYLER